MIKFKALHPRADDFLGFIPLFLDEGDPRPAAEQFNEAYAHGGGWNSFTGFKMDPVTYGIKYPGDPVIMPVAQASFRDELILVYPYAWVAIVQPDDTYEIARMD